MGTTEVMNGIKTGVMDAGNGLPKKASPVLLTATTHTENGETYEISADLIAIGGEAQVYHAIEKNTGKHCAAKIDTSGMIMYKPAERENRMRVVEFLKAHTDYKKYHIIPLLASGFIKIQGADGLELPYPIDIFPFCPDKDLDAFIRNTGKKFTYDELRTKVIPALSAALSTIHENNLIHRDIKPANIYELGGEIVVSDFGTAVVVENDDDDTPHHTELARRTLGYSAPEINSRYAKKASDYFSLGCTLATLYNGKHPYETVLSKESDYAFYELISEKGIAMDYRKGDEPLKHLIDALIKIKPSERITHEGIALWLSNTTAFFEKYGGRAVNDGQWKTPFSFEDAKYWNERDLAAAMAANWTAAKRYLYRGQLLDFFKGNQTLHNRIDQIMNEMPTAKNEDLGLAYFLHYLYKGGNFHWCGREYKELSEIATNIWQNESKGDTASAAEITKMLQSEYLSWKINATMQIPELPADVKSKMQKNLSGVTEIERITKKYPHLAYYYAMFQWGKEPELDLSGVTPDKQFSQFVESPAAFYEEIIKLMNDDLGWAIIASMRFKDGFNYINDVMTLKGKLCSNARDNIVSIYEFFESICNDKAVVRAHYYVNGPDSYLYWLKNKLTLYSFNSRDAQSLKARIEGVRFSDSMTLSDIKNSFRELNGYFAEGGDFQRLFQSDFVLACMGLTKSKDKNGDITATHADAFFIDSFFGKSVPAGFRKSLNLPPKIGADNTVTIHS